jgi:hypothetical protein
MRRRSANADEIAKDFTMPDLAVQPLGGADDLTASITQQSASQSDTTAVTHAEPAPQELTVVNQWTDENGYTWRAMSDGSNQWWTGTDWQNL